MRLIAVALALVGGTLSAQAQCLASWSAIDSSTSQLPATDGFLSSSAVFDPDGGGPLPPRLAVSGNFTVAGSVYARNAGVFDPTTQQWGRLGELAPSTPLITRANGDLLAVNRGLLKWNGVDWTPILSYAGTIVNCIAPADNSIVFVGRSDDNMIQVMRWDGTNTTMLGATPYLLGAVALDQLPTGDLVLFGQFTSFAGTPIERLARYANGAWTQIGTGAPSTVTRMFTLTDGSIVIAGDSLTSVDGVAVNRIARLDGATWRPMGAGLTGVPEFITLPNGHVIAAGSVASLPEGPAHWNGTTWQSISGEYDRTSPVLHLGKLPDGRVFAQSDFTRIGTVNAAGLAAWDGSSWSSLAAPITTANISCMAKGPDDDFYLGAGNADGRFVTATGQTIAALARYDGTSFHAVGTPIAGRVTSILFIPSGEMWIAGDLVLSPGAAPVSVARWNGTTWIAVGSVPPPFSPLESRKLLQSASGTISLFADAQGVFVWNGTDWSLDPAWLTTFSNTISIYDVEALANGHMYASGVFFSGPGQQASLAYFDGTAWRRVDEPRADVTGLGLAPLPDARVITVARNVGFSPTYLTRTQNRYSFAIFSLQPPLRAVDFAVTPEGTIFVGGIAFGSNGDCAARWTGSAWVDIDTSVIGSFERLFTFGDGDIYFTGQTIRGLRDSLVARKIIRYRPASSIEFSSQPQPVTTRPATAAAFSVALAPSQSATFAWRKDGVIIPVATNPTAATSTLTLSNVTPSDQGLYDCLVTIACGTAPSASASLIVTTELCDSIDFNNNAVFPEDQDVIDFFNVLSGAICPTCSDIDFNNNGVFPEDQDVIDFFNVLAGGSCGG